MSRIIGVGGDGETYSIEAAKNLHGADVIEGFLANDGVAYEDHEGNPLHPMFSIEYDEESEMCGGCLHTIAECTCSSGLYRMK